MFGFYSYGYYYARRCVWSADNYWALIILGIIEDAAAFFLDLSATRSTVPPWGSDRAMEARARAIDK